jgi:hypothetical protein
VPLSQLSVRPARALKPYLSRASYRKGRVGGVVSGKMGGKKGRSGGRGGARASGVVAASIYRYY